MERSGIEGASLASRTQRQREFVRYRVEPLLHGFIIRANLKGNTQLFFFSLLFAGKVFIHLILSAVMQTTLSDSHCL